MGAQNYDAARTTMLTSIIEIVSVICPELMSDEQNGLYKAMINRR